ncbi:MAG: hypothetical protein AAGC74_03425 [Verrucomicrobiota bacterium]
MLSILLQSGNLFGLLGLALIFWAGLHIRRISNAAGLSLIAGSSFFLIGRFYNLFFEPAVAKAMLFDLSAEQIILNEMLLPLFLTGGILAIALGLVVVTFKQLGAFKKTA